MKLHQYGNKVTKGEYVIDQFAMSRAFYNLDNCLKEYVLGRKYLNDNSNRFKPEGAFYDISHNVVLSAKATVSGNDSFDSSVGESMVQLKLHKKAFDFMLQFKNLLGHEIDDLVSAIEHTKIPNFPDFDTVFSGRYGSQFKYSVSENVSYVKIGIPFLGQDGILDCIHKYATSVLKKMDSKRGVYPSGKWPIVQFVNIFEYEATGLVRDNIRGNMKDKNDKDAWFNNEGVITVFEKVKRNPDDQNDEEYAKRKLYQKLVRYWISINKQIKRIMINTLKARMRFQVRGRIIKKANRCLERCRKIGFDCGLPADFDFNQYNKGN